MEIQEVSPHTTLKLSWSVIEDNCLAGQDSTPQKADLDMSMVNNVRMLCKLHIVVKL